MKNDNHSAAQIQMWWENGHGNLLYDLTCGFIIDFEEKRKGNSHFILSKINTLTVSRALLLMWATHKSHLIDLQSKLCTWARLYKVVFKIKK